MWLFIAYVNVMILSVSCDLYVYVDETILPVIGNISIDIENTLNTKYYIELYTRIVKKKISYPHTWTKQRAL